MNSNHEYEYEYDYEYEYLVSPWLSSNDQFIQYEFNEYPGEP